MGSNTMMQEEHVFCQSSCQPVTQTALTSSLAPLPLSRAACYCPYFGSMLKPRPLTVRGSHSRWPKSFSSSSMLKLCPPSAPFSLTRGGRWPLQGSAVGSSRCSVDALKARRPSGPFYCTPFKPILLFSSQSPILTSQTIWSLLLQQHPIQPICWSCPTLTSGVHVIWSGVSKYSLSLGQTLL